MKKSKMMPGIVLTLRNGYTKKMLKSDIIAGIIVGIISLPLSIGLAIVAGAPPATGLITAIFAGISTALFGGSKTQISGPTGAFAIVIFGIIASFGYSGLLMATFMAGIFLLLFGLLRLGSLIKYIPLPVVTGFTAGIAAIILVAQLNHFLGLNLTNVPVENVAKFVFIIKNITHVCWQTLGLGMLALFILIVLPKFQKIVPAVLIAIIVCTGINLLLPTKSITLGDVYGDIKVNIKFSTSFFDFALLPKLIIPALTIAFLSSVETLLSAVVADGMTNDTHNPNMELIGMGTANLSSSLFGGVPATSAIARASANINNGGRTPFAAISYAATMLFLSLFLMPFAKHIPMTVFAAILLMVYYNMFNVPEVRKIFIAKSFDILLMIATFILTVAFNLVTAILAGAFIALLYYLIQSKIRKKHGYAHLAGDTTCLKGHINYINHKKLILLGGRHEIKLCLKDVVHIDATAMDFLQRKARKKRLYIVATNDNIKSQLAKHDLLKDLI